MKYKGMNFPANASSKISNPLKKSDKGKLKAAHNKQLGASGVKSPKSPL